MLLAIFLSNFQQFSHLPLEERTHAKCFGVAFSIFFFPFCLEFYQHFSCKLNDLYLFTVEEKKLNSFETVAFERKHALKGVYYVCSFFDVCL